MKRITQLAAAFALIGSVAYGQSAVDAAVKALTDQGFTNFEIKQFSTTTKIEATNGTQQIEVVIDNETGATIKSETENQGAGTDESGDDNSASSGDDSGDDESGDDNGSDDDGDDGEDGDNSGSNSGGNSGSDEGDSDGNSGSGGNSGGGTSGSEG